MLQSTTSCNHIEFNVSCFMLVSMPTSNKELDSCAQVRSVYRRFWSLLNPHSALTPDDVNNHVCKICHVFYVTEQDKHSFVWFFITN